MTTSEIRFNLFDQIIQAKEYSDLSQEAKDVLCEIVACMNKKILEKGEPFYRVQLGGKPDEYRQVDDSGEEKLHILDILPYEESRMIPTCECINSRFNCHNPVLYFSDEIDTAIAEKRPWHGVPITIALFTTTQPMKMLEMPNKYSHSIPLKQRLKVLCAISRIGQISEKEEKEYMMQRVYSCFSAPDTESLGDVEYKITQMIGEHIQKMGYDGILYPSAAKPKGVSGLFFCPPDNDPQKFFPEIINFEDRGIDEVKSVEIKMKKLHD